VRCTFSKKPGRKPPDRPTGVIGTDAEQEGRSGVVPAQDLEQARDALAGATKRVDIDLEGEEHRADGERLTDYTSTDPERTLRVFTYSTSARASATWPR